MVLGRVLSVATMVYASEEKNKELKNYFDDDNMLDFV